MKLKKVISIVVLLLICLVYTCSSNIVYAGKDETARTFRLMPLMTGEDPSFGYAIGNPNVNETDSQTKTAAKIWNIVEQTGEDQIKNDEDIICLREGLGFHGENQSAVYDYSYDMKTEKTDIINIFKSAWDWSKDIDGINQYNGILAVLDLLYVKGQSSDTYRQELLENAIGKGQYAEYVDAGIGITDNDIKAVQQAAVWYFTNYGENSNNLYDQTGNNEGIWLFYSTTGVGDYTSLSGYNSTTGEGVARQRQAGALYNYLITTAKANANNYNNLSTQTVAPATVDKSRSLTYETSSDGNNYIVGPMKITERENNTTNYSIDFEVKNGNTLLENSGYTLLKADKTSANTTNVKDLVGQDFYISIPKNSVTISGLKIGITVNYEETTLRVWTSGTDKVNQQPVVITEKENKSVSAELTFEKKFDLALRKYITKINGVELNEANTRVPSIDESSLTSGNTATYKHRKDPVTIASGDKVTYKLTVYNEGEKAGRATKIVDQLPTGLRFSKIVSGNFVADTTKATNGYDTTTNTVYLTRVEGNENNLPAYEQGNLVNNGKGSETIEIECEVTETPDTVKSKILTNIAWISEEYDAESNKTITNTKGEDIDSEPATYPNKTASNLNTIDIGYTGKDNKEELSDKNYYYKGEQDDDDFEKLVLLPESFDLKLIKRITAVNNQNVPERIKSVDVSKLNTTDSNGNIITTAEYNLNEEPVPIKKGDIVTYTFRIYNEGTIDGYAKEITEDIPEGLEFIWSEKEGEELKADTTLTAEEKEAIEFNQNYLWGKFVYDEKGEKIVKISSDYLSKEKETTVGGNLIQAFGKNDGTKTENDLKYKEISVKLKVVSENTTGTIIKNEACISDDSNANGDPVDDRDSHTDIWNKDPNHEDDEDHDFIILQSFDLALRKFIIAVSNDTKIENYEYLKNTDGSYTRAPVVETSKLNTTDGQGKIITTATYNHTKKPVEVKKNDNIVYMLRVYNEGEIDGYAAEIKDHLPPNLEFVDGDFNKQYGWEVSEDGRTVTTKYLENEKIAAAVREESSSSYKLTYKEVPIMCKVKEGAKINENITNIAEISKYLDDNKKTIIDRDSEENNVKLPADKDLPGYKGDENGSYVPGQQDDDDFEKVIIKKFDLALRKFITKIGDKDVTTRVPQVKYENGKITYEHDKTPLQVVTNNVVTYTIRVFNEGEIAGYAKEITDDIPAGLEFLPDNEVNKEMRWKMVDAEGKETTDVTKAVKITTDYLSKEQEKEKNGNLLKAFDPNEEIVDKNPDYKDVQVAFKVTEPNSSDKIIINSAQISDDSDKNGDPVEDEDSIPNEWNEGEDDQDKEYIKLVEFDLALRKWVTQAIVIDNNGQTVTETGHEPYDDPEQIVKVELHRKKLNEVTVKFRYSIRVINEGEIEGYAKEVTDYIPEGLKFIAEDNPGWTDEGNNVISTRLLENTLLKPGEYADVEVLLTWVNDQDNMGLKVNTAEISEDYNEYGIPDKDSTPDNQKPGEDDIDDAPVMLSLTTGQIKIYFTLGFIVLITIASGVVLIKKFVL